MTSPTPASPPQAETTIRIADEAGLAGFARRLVEVLQPRAFVALSGDLGAGKTTLVKAVAAAAGIDPAEVISPTFGLIHEHPLPAAAGRPTRLVHADMYRLTGTTELAETGWDDAVAGDTWVFVEWPERIAAALPAERLEITIGIDSPTARTLVCRGLGPAGAAAVAALAS
ncbi:MAG: tRNA (adenosine(37)-N6)-threonylcarbamoyltransferase complex ATPase subunit type 1 TsaE [Planctomycetota bacterium]